MTEYAGQAKSSDYMGEYNALHFLITSLMNQMNTATLVKVISCTNTGALSPTGFVDIQPLVNQLDGSGTPIPHGVIHNVPYFRIQGGSNAVILDPQPGDIGMAVFADHDISGVKANLAASNPGSFRRFDFADGMYFGGLLNGTPTQFVQFQASGITVVSPTEITLQAPSIKLVGTVDQSGGTLTAETEVITTTVTASSDVSVAGLSVKSHTHPYSPGTGATTETGGMQS